MAATPRMGSSLGKLRLAFYPSGLPDLGQPQVGPARSHVTGNSSHTAALASSPAPFGHAVSTPSSLDPFPHLSNLQVKREMASDKQGREEARSCPVGSVGKRPNRTHDKIQGTRGVPGPPGGVWPMEAGEHRARGRAAAQLGSSRCSRR